MSDLSRREFIRQSLVLAAVSGSSFAINGTEIAIRGKSGLRILNNRPWNAEALPHQLDPAITPTEYFFVRNNGIPPLNVDVEKWRLRIDGESAVRDLELSIGDLKKRYENVSLQLLVECGGNGRAEFDPSVPGNQWSLGAVGCPLFHGVRLRDVLGDAGIKNDAVYIGYRGADTHLSGDIAKLPISRGVPINKALADDAMIAWGMNGGDLHPMNGYPLRLVVAGWPGSVSGKWLTGISIRDKVHDGPKMDGKSYRVPMKPVAPGSEVDDSDMKIIEAMPVKSLITYPETGFRHLEGEPLQVRGHAWAGDRQVQQVCLSTDFGQHWQEASLSAPRNRGSWQQFLSDVTFKQTGYHEVWARASDDRGKTRPMVLPGWNPKGYLNNACHRIAVNVA